MGTSCRICPRTGQRLCGDDADVCLVCGRCLPIVTQPVPRFISRPDKKWRAS